MKFVIETSEMNEICYWSEISELVNPFFEMSEICYWKRVKWVKWDKNQFLKSPKYIIETSEMSEMC